MVADAPTLFLMIIVASVTTALAALVVAGGQEDDEGLGLWAAAMLLHAAAFGLLSMRGRLPDLSTVVLANTLLAACFALVQEALAQFLRQPVLRYLVWTPVALTGLGFYLLMNAPVERQLIGAALFLFPLGLLLWTLHRHAGAIAGRGKYLLATGFLLLALVLLLRGVLIAAGVADMSQPLASLPLQTLTFMASFVVVTLSSFGFVFMTKERSDERNRELAMHDSLTGLPNRRAIMQALEQQFSLAQRSEQPLSVLMLDIDHFKRINDCFGHPAGDEVLRCVAQRLAERIRVQDIAGRFGGEEFLILLPGTAPEGARLLAENLRVSIAAQPVLTSWQAVGVTVSVGVFGGVMAEAQELDSLLERADRALYRAKERGRNRVELD